MRLIIAWLVMCLFCAPALAEESIPLLVWTVPEGMTAATPDDAGAAAAALHTDADALAAALTENNAVLLLVTPDGSVLQLSIAPSEMDGLDFGSMGRKKVTILAGQLARTNGMDAAVIRIGATGTEPEPTAAPGSHRCKLWIRLTPNGTDYPREELWITAVRGYDITLWCTWASADDEALYATQVQDLLWSLIVTPPVP